ncbi:UMP kinase [bacterium]|nr:UMP kinase [bacterium]
MPSSQYQRVVLKLSGETLSGEGKQGVDFLKVATLCEELKPALDSGTQIALVLGGGNIFRGRDAADLQLDRVAADRLGMLATIVNASALGAALASRGFSTRVFSATPMSPLAEPYSVEAARAALDRGELVFASGGIGSPFFSTDTTAALRALELGAQALLKGTKVDGIYASDPKLDPTATRYDTLSYDEALAKDLKVMDATAMALCRDGGLPVRVFDFSTSGNLKRILSGEPLGTLLQ